VPGTLTLAPSPAMARMIMGAVPPFGELMDAVWVLEASGKQPVLATDAH
jgi:hypothetical protein